jgi:signal transduction histidine kinase
MSRLVSLGTASTQGLSECFVVVDSDVHAHGEWHNLKEMAPRVSAGDQLIVEWDEAFSIGMGGRVEENYAAPSSGTYYLRVQTLDLFGRPKGEESSLRIRVLAPWWQRPWVWGLALAATIASTAGLTRYFAHRRIREQLVHLKEEQLVERERLRIARDLHDTLAQGFTGVIVQLQAAEDAYARGLAEETTAHLKCARSLARDSLEEARRSVRSLRQPASEQKELTEAFGALLDRMTADTDLRAELMVDGEPRRIASEVEQNLLRIGQEALVNALRHARASRFSSRLIFAEETLRLEFQDDGCGFDQTAAHDGFGLIGMKERVRAMGGQFLLQSTKNGGTTISIVLAAPWQQPTGEPS